MGVDYDSYIVIGLRMKKSDPNWFITKTKVVHDFCKCKDNDRSQPFCSKCGNKNETKTRMLKVKKIKLTNNGLYKSISIGGNTYQVISHDGYHYFSAVVIKEVGNRGSRCESVSLPSDGEKEKMRSDFTKLGLWDDNEFGAYLIMKISC